MVQTADASNVAAAAAATPASPLHLDEDADQQHADMLATVSAAWHYLAPCASAAAAGTDAVIVCQWDADTANGR